MATEQSEVTFGPIKYRYGQLAKATDHFSNNLLLGEGGFGQVYKGSLDGKTNIAVKKLKCLPEQSREGLTHEIMVVSSVRHRNLVRLLGYCIDGANGLLVFDFFPNKSLKSHLQGRKEILDWPKRMKIALGSAKGLEYLHEHCDTKIIHRDIKSDNILLDNNFEAKVADFGIALFFPDADVTHLTKSVVGTEVYVDPENPEKVSEKSDIYSFGVVLLELISGRAIRHQGINIVTWAENRIQPALNGQNMDLIDSKLQGKYEEKEMKRMISCAADCVYKPSKLRPQIKEVVRALEGYVRDDNPNLGGSRQNCTKPQEPIFIPKTDKGTEANNYHRTFEKPSSSGNSQVYKPRRFTYQKLSEATEGFSEQNFLTQGGFGATYKGFLDGKIVAVKKLFDLPNEQKVEELEKEIEVVSKVSHSNLVNPIGYCIEKQGRLLVIEFIASKSLKAHLHGNEKLAWSTRMKIATACAKGLEYLHESCKIMHGNISSNNIFLDNNLEPKIASFGLAKFYRPSFKTNIFVNTEDHTEVSEKSDIYDFGVVLLELITGRGGNVVKWAKDLIKPALINEKYKALLDSTTHSNYNTRDVVRMIYCAAACVYRPSDFRPQMKEDFMLKRGNIQ
ncbi:hypothetical protein MANES_03G076800v8 [Manihot esculenta]|uniref:Uncharacterized protein n=1 Tax=Manihot esculenta TaxID=3983 RepID=A0A2C9W5M1_MANES|nr:hypothetical protein MANES_03G076800v8 [Manihot esculenta]